MELKMLNGLLGCEAEVGMCLSTFCYVDLI